MEKLDQDTVIKLFLAKYNEKTASAFAITQWPDKIKRSQIQTEREIDAIAEASGKTSLAIEHTIIQTRFEQMAVDAQFMKVIADLEEALKQSNLPFSLQIFLPHDGIKKGQNWKELGDQIKNHILLCAQSLPYGRTELAIDGVPFVVVAEKTAVPATGMAVAGTGRYGLKPGYHKETKEIIKDALINKANAMKKYKNSCRTLLLLESNDLATMAPDIFANCFNEVSEIEEIAVFDEIWACYAHQVEEILWLICLRNLSSPALVFNVDRDMW